MKPIIWVAGGLIHCYCSMLQFFLQKDVTTDPVNCKHLDGYVPVPSLFQCSDNIVYSDIGVTYIIVVV